MSSSSESVIVFSVSGTVVLFSVLTFVSALPGFEPLGSAFVSAFLFVKTGSLEEKAVRLFRLF